VNYNDSLVARLGKCLHNVDIPPTKPSEKMWAQGNDESGTAHGKSEKTQISARYKVVASLENTLDDGYITEKRYQALLAGSIPLVWKYGTSVDFLPSPDSAIFPED